MVSSCLNDSAYDRVRSAANIGVRITMGGIVRSSASVLEQIAQALEAHNQMLAARSAIHERKKIENSVYSDLFLV